MSTNSAVPIQSPYKPRKQRGGLQAIQTNIPKMHVPGAKKSNPANPAAHIKPLAKQYAARARRQASAVGKARY